MDATREAHPGAIRAAICGLVFLLSALVHCGTWVPSLALDMEHSWPLHLCAIACGGMLAFALGSYAKLREQEGTRSRWSAHSIVWKPIWDIGKSLPVPLRIAGMLFVGYVIITAAFGFGIEGQPRQEGDRFVLKNHGQLIRGISESEFYAFEGRLVRFFSCGWMWISGLSTLYFWKIHPPLMRRPRPVSKLASARMGLPRDR